jgi:FkbM family methyltransferase
LLRNALRWVQRRGNTPFVNWVRKIAYAAYRATYSPNYHMDTNGELRALRIAGPAFDRRVIFDVGANVGEWSLAAAGLPDPVRVYSFEPSAKTFARLVEATRAKPQVECFNMGLSRESGPLEIMYSARNPEKSSVEAGAAALHGTKISDYVRETQNFMRGDEFCDKHGIDRITYLKIDTEGHDLQVLRGFGDRLGDGRIAVIQFEYNRMNLYARSLLLDFHDLLNPPSLPTRYRIGRIYPGSVHFKDYDYADENFIDGNFLAVWSSLDGLVSSLKSGRHGS